jgi:hypothetical protein
MGMAGSRMIAHARRHRQLPPGIVLRHRRPAGDDPRHYFRLNASLPTVAV